MFDGGLGIDTVDYSGRTANGGVRVTMDGLAANDGERDVEGDNVKGDVENLVGSSRADDITGNGLSNTITGGLGADILTGGAGDDLFDEGADLTSGQVDSDVIVGGLGVDTVDYSRRHHALTIRLDVLADSGDQSVFPSEADTLDCENATGGRGINTMLGSAGPNELFGGPSADIINGGAGDDILDGAGGADTLNGGAGDGDICFDNGSFSKTSCEL